MSEISHNSIFEFLSIDTGVQENELYAMLASSGTAEFMKYLEKKSASVFNNETCLFKDLCDLDGKVLISSRVSLGKHLPVLFDRYIKEKKFRTSEVLVHIGGPLMKIYQNALRQRLLMMYEGFVIGNGRYGDMVKHWLNESPAYNKYIDMFFSELVSTPQGVAKALDILRLRERDDAVLREASAMLTFTLKVCMTLVSRKVILADNKKMIMRLIGAGFFFYFLLRHIASVSSDFTEDEKARLLSYYSSMKPSPMFLEKDRDLLTVRVLITIHIFMALLEKNNLKPNSMDANRLMRYLSEAGYTDNSIVSVLSEIFLPKAKHSLLEYAMKIKSKCTQSPVIWGIAGDMMPVRIICAMQDCEFASHHKTFIPADVKVSADMVFCTNVRGGIYYKCDKLTARLETFFNDVIRAQKAVG